MTYIIAVFNLLVLAGLAFLVWRKSDTSLRNLYWPALLFKSFAGLALGWLYWKYYETGDTFVLFDQGEEKAQLLYHDPGAWFRFLLHDTDTEWKGAARSLFFVKIVSIWAVLTAGIYWITSLWFSFIGFLASWYLVHRLHEFFPKAKLAASVAFLFFPSVAFWSSGVVKESVALAGLLVIAAMYLQGMMNQKPGWKEWVVGIVGFWIVWNLKYYWIAVLFPVVATSLLVQWTATRFALSSKLKLPLWVLLFLFFCFIASQAHPNFRIDRFLKVVVESHDAFAAVSKPSGLIHYHDLRATWKSLLANAPLALLSGLFRPFVWEAGNILQLMVSLENLLTLALTVSALFRFREFFSTPNRLITVSVAAYTVILCVFLALSTPNWGSLARYKVGFLPFLVFLITYRNPLINAWLSSPGLNSLKKWLN